MFKRVEKKITRKRKEEELGITEEIKEAIGLNDVDSDDSSSDESEASSSSTTPGILSKRKRSFEEELDDCSAAASGSDTSDEAEDEDGVQMTVDEALHNPLYLVSIQPDIRGCFVCPRKILKNDTMVSVHTKSQVSRIPTHVNAPRALTDIVLFCRVGPSAADDQIQGSGRIFQTRR